MTHDLPALEKHFVDQFVHGKPLIQLHIQQITYRKDAFSIANIRKRVAPQVCEFFLSLKQNSVILLFQIKLGAREKAEIIKELHTIKSLRDCLDIVEIMMGFLSSGQTDPEIELRTYVSKSLKMGKKFSCKKVNQ